MQKLWIVDCLTGKRASVDGGPYIVGSFPNSDLIVGSGDEDATLLRITRVLKAYHIYPGNGTNSILFDGQEVSNIGIRDESEHTIVVRGYPFVLRAGAVDDDK